MLPQKGPHTFKPLNSLQDFTRLVQRLQREQVRSRLAAVLRAAVVDDEALFKRLLFCSERNTPLNLEALVFIGTTDL